MTTPRLEGSTSPWIVRTMPIGFSFESLVRAGAVGVGARRPVLWPGRVCAWGPVLDRGIGPPLRLLPR
ncbi:hypothetical protein MANAM107_16030 [Actinomyces capricornis]|uniref:Uncharacterized protein n=1 Tax=Actinomyces capricornis TaxID=2755559 RepID=A0ABM7UBT1_9ACTO|nr:hypothetical protein MANAM107_16030 [Actinomyces capricornis]